MKTYSASVKTGILEETLLETGEHWGLANGNTIYSTLDTHCINADERQSLIALGYTISDSQRWLNYSSQAPLSKWPPLNSTFPDSMYQRDCVYGLDLPFANSLALLFNDLLSGNVTGLLPVGENDSSKLAAPQVLQRLFNFGNVTFESMNSRFEQIAVSLTNYMRQNGVVNSSSPALGTISQEKACVAVRWPWLVYPSALVLMTIIFFILVVLQTRPTGSRQDIWKSSPLALLYHGLVDREGRPLDLSLASDANYIRGMEAIADAMQVKLGSYHDRVTRLEVQN